MGKLWSSLFPPKPEFTEKNLPDQSGKVFLVTGGSGGIGKELVSILFQKNAKVYMAARSVPKAKAVIEEIQRIHHHSTGQIVYLHLDLNDLTTIKKSADEFLAKEIRLDVLWNNAGVMFPPNGSKTAQGYELQLGTNNLATFLFTHHLIPIMEETAKTASKDSVRVVWVSSSAVGMAPKPAIDFSNMDYRKEENTYVKYGRSKAGSVLHSAELARRTADQGVLSLSLNPGNYATDLQRHMPGWQASIFKTIFAYPVVNGAYTELFAGLHSSITKANNGGWVAPFGRIEPGRKDLWDPKLGHKYWEWTMKELKPYL